MSTVCVYCVANLGRVSQARPAYRKKLQIMSASSSSMSPERRCRAACCAGQSSSRRRIESGSPQSRHRSESARPNSSLVSCVMGSTPLAASLR